MSPSQWGPSTWIFFHTLVEKVREERFAEIGPALIQWIRTICTHLPCPDCTVHASHFWAHVKMNQVKTKTDLKHLLFVFHNMVNVRKRMPAFRLDALHTTYAAHGLLDAFAAFRHHFHTHGNMKLLTESFHRNQMMRTFQRWFFSHLSFFHVPPGAVLPPRLNRSQPLQPPSSSSRPLQPPSSSSRPLQPPSSSSQPSALTLASFDPDTASIIQQLIS